MTVKYLAQKYPGFFVQSYLDSQLFRLSVLHNEQEQHHLLSGDDLSVPGPGVVDHGVGDYLGSSWKLVVVLIVTEGFIGFTYHHYQ